MFPFFWISHVLSFLVIENKFYFVGIKSNIIVLKFFSLNISGVSFGIFGLRPVRIAGFIASFVIQLLINIFFLLFLLLFLLLIKLSHADLLPIFSHLLLIHFSREFFLRRRHN